jgi:hypothetical protein
VPETVQIVMPRGCLIAGLVLMSGIPGWLRAQGVNRVTGLITDQSGAVVVGAAVQARELSTNITLRGVSNDRGDYLLQLPIGLYTVAVSCAGSTTAVRENVPVNVGADVRLHAHILYDVAIVCRPAICFLYSGTRNTSNFSPTPSGGCSSRPTDRPVR